MTTNAKTFRLFISSTFNDFKLERQVLHEKVFPEINKYLSINYPEYTFQPVDLRWGVSEEAQLDQKTLDLCLNEVRACKHYPHPNFLVMLGNRYGWVGVPSSIEEKEFKSLYQYVKTHHADKITYLDYWYRLDNNVVPPTYVLWERSDERANKDIEKKFGKEFQKDFATLDAPDDKEKKEWNSAWSEHEGILRDLLQEAVQKTIDESDYRYRKYFLSATEAEVEEGILKYTDLASAQRAIIEKEKNETLPELDAEYVYAWIRNISNAKTVNKSEAPGKFYIDNGATKEEDNLLPESRNFRKKVTAILAPHHNIEASSVVLNNDPDQPITDVDYLRKFETFIVKKLKNAIYKQVKKAKKLSEVDEKHMEQLQIPAERYLALKEERSEQLRFKSLKTETFFGRDKELKVVQDYINDTARTQPFIVHGISGIGKSSFIAKAIDQIEEAITYRVAYRFIGATAFSSNIRTLLESLIADLADQGVLELPEVFEEDSNKFNVQIKELLANIEQPTVIILDALDQLQYKDYLQWLPLELKSKLKIILSMLDQKGYEHYYKLLEKKIDQINQCEILPLDEEAGRETLEALLKKEERSLTEEQFEYVIEQYKKSNSSPLYLKIVFEEVKTWRSTETIETLSVGIQEIIKEFINNLTDKFHHDRTIVHKVLGLISASRDGLSEKEILDLLSRDEKILSSLEKFTNLTLEIEGETVRRFPISIWARLSEQLRPFLNERLIDGQNLITFFHRQIDEAVRDYIYEPNKDILHKELAAYFLTLQNKEETWDKRYYNPHMLDEVPYQLFHTNDEQETKRLKEILFDLEFAGSIYDHHKQIRFREIMEKASELDDITYDEIYPWESFYREKEHLITQVHEALWRPHQSLFQLAYEDGDNSPLSQEVDSLLELDKIKFNWLRKKNRSKEYNRTGLVKVFEGHSDSVNGVEVLENGSFVSYSEDGTLRQWGLDGTVLRVFKGHSCWVRGIKVVENKYIISYSCNDNTLILWDMFGNIINVAQHNDCVRGFKILQCGNILSYSDDKTLIIWSNEGDKLKVLDEHNGSVEGAIILKDGRILSYSTDNTLIIWSNQGDKLKVLNKHNGPIRGVKILEDGRILSYSDDKTLMIWSNEGDKLKVLDEHNGSINGVKILKDGSILSYSSDSTLIIWSKEGEFLRVLNQHNGSVYGAKILKDGSILSYSTDNTLIIWSNDSKSYKVLQGHSDEINGVEIVDNKYILSYSGKIIDAFEQSYDNTVKIWNFSGDLLKTIEGHNGAINTIKILKNNRILTCSNDHTIRLWEFDIEQKHIDKKHNSWINGVQVLDDGRIISYSEDKSLILWNKNGKFQKTLKGHTDSIKEIKILSNGNILSYLGERIAHIKNVYENKLRLWDSNGNSIKTLDKHNGAINGVKILKDGKILSYSDDKTLIIWSKEGECLRILNKHDDAINGVKILNDGRILSYSYATLIIWSKEGEFLKVLKDHDGAIEGRNGRIKGVIELKNGNILSYSHDSALILWNSDGNKLKLLKGGLNESGSSAVILDNERFISYSNDLIIWSNEGEKLKVLDKHNGGISGVKILEDGRILSYTADKIIIWSNNGIKLRVLEGNKEAFGKVKILNNIIVSYSYDGAMIQWDYSGNMLNKWYLISEDTRYFDIQDNKIFGANNSNLLYYEILINSNQKYIQ